MNHEDRKDVLKYFTDAAYELIKHSELFDAVKVNGDMDRLAREYGREAMALVEKRIDDRVAQLEMAPVVGKPLRSCSEMESEREEELEVV